MSHEIGIDTINLRPTPRLAHMEYCTNDALARHVGEDKLADWFQTDVDWRTHDGPVPWSERGRTTDMGHAEFLEDGRDRRDSVSCPSAASKRSGRSTPSRNTACLISMSWSGLLGAVIS